MGWKAGKTLKNLLYTGAFIAATNFLPGCEPEEPEPSPPDITPPSITISSPLENKVYESSTISYEGAIQEAHFKSAWYSTDNEQTKNPITEKSWKKDLELPNGNHNLITYADDSAGNFSRKSILFSVNKIIVPPKMIVNPFVQPNDSTLNWYGSGDVNNDNSVNSQDLTRMNELIAGTYSNPSDTRLKDRADINGDEVVNNQDKQLLENKLNGVIAYLPGEWNKLPDREKREDWLKKMLKIDQTSEIEPFPGWDCTQFSYQTMINFHGCSLTDISKFLEAYPYDASNNGRFNLPLYSVTISYYNSNNEHLGGHSMNTMFLGKSSTTWGDRCDIEPQFDHINVQIGQDYLDGTNSKFYIRGPPITLGELPNGTKDASPIFYILYKIKNNVPNLELINPDIDLVTQREK